MSKLKLVLLLVITFQAEAKPCKKVTAALLELYPEHTKSIMVARFEKATNKHKFLRSFIPYYYQQIHKHADKLPAFQKASKTKGYIAGDAHVENFGFLVDNNGKSIMALNDFDDVAQSSLVMDVMRLSQSASYVNKELDQTHLIQAYLKGLNDKPYELSEYINKLAAKASGGGKLSKAEFTTTATGKQFAIKQAPTFATTQAQHSGLEAILKKKYGKDVKLHDSYRTMKESGGSAYGTRYHLLAEFDGQVHFIELKEASGSGVVPELLSKAQTNPERILGARNTFLGNNFDRQLDVVAFENQNFQLRFKAKGNKSIDLGKARAEEIPKIIEDEFFILGQLHRKSLAASEAPIAQYTKDIHSISIKEWDETIKFMRERIKTAFDKVNE